MIIKKVRIKSFGGIKDKEFSFERGFNLVYGENEKGKSTIQNFIRAWLYGFGNSRGAKNNLRKRYLPFSGEKMQGELVLEYNKREYIIQRTFGATKKDDTSNIYDGLTGDEIKEINKDEPGTYFLGVNGNTFIKTLFIPQLGVLVSKDKEEQIMQRIIDVFGCGEGEVSVDKAVNKLKDSRKELTTSRKNGELDILKSRYSKVIEERYEAYKVAEDNLINENELINKKEERNKIREEITKLELFKKYLKKSKLQKEYGEITTYLKKSESLKKQEKEIDTELKRENGIISEEYINDLSEENKRYLTLLDIKKENEYDLKEVEKRIVYENGKLDSYEVFMSMEDDLKEKLIRLNTEQEGLRERVLLNKKIKLSIEEEEKKLEQKRKFLGDVFKLTSHKEEIKLLFKNYEDKLRELKENIEVYDYDDNVGDSRKGLELKRNISIFSAIIGGLILGINLASVSYILLYTIGSILIVGGAAFAVSLNGALKDTQNKFSNKENIDRLNKEIKNIEEQLTRYMHLIKCNNYENLLRAVNTLENFYVLEARVKLRIEDRSLQLEGVSLEKDEERYNQNNKILSSIMKLCGCDTLDEIYIQLDEFKKVKNNLTLFELEYNSKKESLNRITFELEEKEKDIKSKLELMNLENVQLIDLEMYLKGFREKISEKKDLEKALQSVEETYKVLLKDRDIESIKDELQDIINQDMNYSYESEEEIENEIRKKSNLLIELEKKIKDLENVIKTSFLGKRTITAIEEDLENLVESINILDKRLIALNIAIENLEKAGRDIRGSFGPALNNNILNIFKELTGDKYSEVKLGENYDMVVRDNSSMFSGEYLSNGANDQLYLALRLAFIELIFKGREVPIIFDDSFIQYDDIRREKGLKIIESRNFAQTIIFSCQSIEEELLRKNSIKASYIYI